MSRGLLIGLLQVILIAGVAGTNSHDKARAKSKKGLAGGASSHRHSPSHKIVKQPDIEQQLIICNAYASQSALDVYHVQTMDRITSTEPLRYKDCREFIMSLGEGDQLDFKADDLDVGTFYATGLPKSSASLLLIPHRRDSHSVAISFESHAFSDMQSPQLAIVDAYRGKAAAQGAVKITDALPQDGNSSAAEEILKFSSVVAVNPGSYKVRLSENQNSTARSLLAKDQDKYVVMRVGLDNGGFPEELVVFPSSAAFRLGFSLACLAVSILGTMFS